MACGNDWNGRELRFVSESRSIQAIPPHELSVPTPFTEHPPNYSLRLIFDIVIHSRKVELRFIKLGQLTAMNYDVHLGEDLIRPFVCISQDDRESAPIFFIEMEPHLETFSIYDVVCACPFTLIPVTVIPVSARLRPQHVGTNVFLPHPYYTQVRPDLCTP